MDVKILQQGDKSIVSINGRLDTLSAPGFQSEMESLIKQGMTRIVLDLSNVEYLSSAGLRSILIVAQKIKISSGSVVCCQLTGLVKKVFEISRFSEIVPTCESLEDAVDRC